MLKIKTDPRLADGACVSISTEEADLFYGVDYEGPEDASLSEKSAWLRQANADSEAEVKIRYCMGCPVRLVCLTAGMTETDGVWGGWTPEERQRGSMLGSKPRSVISQQRETAVRLVKGGLSVQDVSVKLDITPKAARRYLNEAMSLSVTP